MTISHTWTLECLQSGVIPLRINVNRLDFSGQHSLFMLVKIFQVPEQFVCKEAGYLKMFCEV